MGTLFGQLMRRLPASKLEINIDQDMHFCCYYFSSAVFLIWYGRHLGFFDERFGVTFYLHLSFTTNNRNDYHFRKSERSSLSFLSLLPPPPGWHHLSKRFLYPCQTFCNIHYNRNHLDLHWYMNDWSMLICYWRHKIHCNRQYLAQYKLRQLQSSIGDMRSKTHRNRK